MNEASVQPEPMNELAQRGQAAALAETRAHGFVLYVGLDEENAAENGTSLAQLAKDLRLHAQSLVPQVQSYAAVAVAPADTPGSPLEIVRSTFGDPTVASHRSAPTPSNLGVPPQGVLVDLSRREVFLDGEPLNLTYKEFELVNFLVDNRDRAVSREELINTLWHRVEDAPNERTIDVHIRRLRAKLGRLANIVRTVRGEGYRFYDHPEVMIWAAPEYSI